MAHRAPVALDRVPAARGRSSDRRHARGRVEAARARRGERQPGLAWRGRSAAATTRRAARSAASMSSTSSRRARRRGRGRAGRARAARGRARAASDGEVGPAAVGGRQRVPSQKRDGERASGSASRERAAQRAVSAGHAQAVSAAACALAGRTMRTTSHARPNFSSPQITQREDRTPTAQAVGGGRRERVVVVVPRLAEGEEGQPREVARLVAGVEAPAAEEVAQRVDAVGRRGAGPAAAPRRPTAGRSARRRACRRSASRAGTRRQPTDRPEDERAVDEAHDRVGDQVRRVALRRRAGCG